LSKYIVGSEFPLEEFVWICGFTEVVNFIVQVRCDASAGISTQSDKVALVHDIAGFDKHFPEVRISGLEAEIMQHHNPIPAQFRVI
jgi:hypothetical protein